MMFLFVVAVSVIGTCASQIVDSNTKCFKLVRVNDENKPFNTGFSLADKEYTFTQSKKQSCIFTSKYLIATCVKTGKGWLLTMGGIRKAGIVTSSRRYVPNAKAVPFVSESLKNGINIMKQDGKTFRFQVTIITTPGNIKTGEITPPSDNGSTSPKLTSDKAAVCEPSDMLTKYEQAKRGGNTKRTIPGLTPKRSFTPGNVNTPREPTPDVPEPKFGQSAKSYFQRRSPSNTWKGRRRLLASASRAGATGISRDLLRRKGCLEEADSA